MRYVLSIVSCLIVAFMLGCNDGNTQDSEQHEPEPAVSENPGASGDTTSENTETWIATKNTTRINSSDPATAAVIVSRTIWPSTEDTDRPSGVILTDPDEWQKALASADLIHFPTNGPVLYVDQDQVPTETEVELKRLDPSGISMDEGTQVILAGTSNTVEQTVQSWGFKTKRIDADSSEEFAALIDDYYTKLSGARPDSVIVGSKESPEYTLPAANWISHMPEPLLYVNKDNIPEATSEALNKRNGKANIYILGPESVISKTVEEQLGSYGKVVRVEGDNPYDHAIAFAKYQDPSNGFGWGITTPGHNMSFVPVNNPALAVAAAPFSHLGKHAPMLWISPDNIEPSIHDYLMSIQPKYKLSPSEGPFNHAWITGDERTVPFEHQTLIDSVLEIISETGAGHGAGHSSSPEGENEKSIDKGMDGMKH